MQNFVDINRLSMISKAPTVTFNNFPTQPIAIHNSNSVEMQVTEQILNRYFKYGFAVVELKTELPSSEAVLALGQALGLGEAFTPPLYLSGSYNSTGISCIAAQTEAELTHPSFQRAVGVALHCDGTLQEIGYVKTTIMLCESPGVEGGDTILFNATAAFAKLISVDLTAAQTMINPKVFIRQANINGCSDVNEGPAFAIQDNELVCAYSLTETDSFVATKGVKKADLQRAMEFMNSAAQPGSPFFIQFKLNANQAIILANNKITHGRTPYCNTGSQKRCLYRGLYLKYPKIDNAVHKNTSLLALNYAVESDPV